MKIPSELRVGGHVYKVQVGYTFRERDDVAALADHEKREIRVGEVDGGGCHLSRSSVEQNFMHEVLHCVDVVYNAKKLDEDTIERLSQGLYQVLKDSGMLVEEQGRRK